MSHFSTLKTKIANGEVLVSALQAAGHIVQHNAEVRGYNGVTAKADIVAVLEGDSDIGWTLEDGTYNMIADLWSVQKKHNQAELINKVNGLYAVKLALHNAQSEGLKNATVNVKVHA